MRLGIGQTLSIIVAGTAVYGIADYQASRIEDWQDAAAVCDNLDFGDLLDRDPVVSQVCSNNECSEVCTVVMNEARARIMEECMRSELSDARIECYVADIISEMEEVKCVWDRIFD